MKTNKTESGFTLIELLVVISIIAFLMGILVPVLGRVRRQAKSVVCQSNLRQWGMAFTEYLSDNHNQMPLSPHSPSLNYHPHWQMISAPWLTGLRPYGSNHNDDIIFCPMATKPNLGRLVPGDPDWAKAGSTFVAWGPTPRAAIGDSIAHGSYGTNDRVFHSSGRGGDPYIWDMPARDRNAARIPMLLDGIWPWIWPLSNVHSPPERDGIPFSGKRYHIPGYCINRHNGGVNSLYMDGHVRKVGLKELWTLKWGPNSNTAGRWTLAGGVQPEDWPEWMRGVKDY